MPSGGYPNRGKAGRKKHSPTGIYGETRTAWINLPSVNVVVYEQDDAPWQVEHGFTNEVKLIKLGFQFYGVRQMTGILLTNFTTQELDELKKCLDHAFSQARPICIELDEAAHKAFEDGDDSWSRLYRPDARFIQRGRPDNERSQRKVSDTGNESVVPGTTDIGRTQSEHDPGILGGSEESIPHSLIGDDEDGDRDVSGEVPT